MHSLGLEVWAVKGEDWAVQGTGHCHSSGPLVMASGADLLSGHLQKKCARRGNTWHDRFFVLKPHALWYYAKSTDSEPKAKLPLQPTCQISYITCQAISKRREQFEFKIIWKAAFEDHDGAESERWNDALSEKSGHSGIASKRKQDRQSSWFSYMTGTGGGTKSVSTQDHLLLASDSYEEAEKWVNAIGALLEQLSNMQNNVVADDGGMNQDLAIPRPEVT